MTKTELLMQSKTPIASCPADDDQSIFRRCISSFSEPTGLAPGTHCLDQQILGHGCGERLSWRTHLPRVQMPLPCCPWEEKANNGSELCLWRSHASGRRSAGVRRLLRREEFRERWCRQLSEGWKASVFPAFKLVSI